MSRDYAERRIKDALRQAGGNPTLARQQVIAWTYEDAKLLHELAKPHLPGIVAYNIERIVAAEAGEEAETPARPSPVKNKTTMRPNEFGIEILKAVASKNPTLFGQENNAAPARRGKASKQHMDALRQLAAKSHHDDSE